MYPSIFNLGSYIDTIPRWTVEQSNQDEGSSSSNISLKPLIGSCINNSPPSSSDTEATKIIPQEYVNPTTNEELWWPVDIKRIEIRPTLDVFIKAASPAYLLAGVEVRVPSSCSQDGQVWKNFGINSQPIASQWTSFGIAIEQGFRVETFVGIEEEDEEEEAAEKEQQSEHVKGDSNNLDSSNSKENQADIRVVDWIPLLGLYDNEPQQESCTNQKMHATKGTTNAIQILGDFLANIDETSPLAEGMHIISIPIDNEWRDLPKGTNQKNQKLRLVSIATAEPDSLEVLGLNEDLVAMSATSLLDVRITLVAPGSKSEYIPNVYKPLYIGSKE